MSLNFVYTVDFQLIQTKKMIMEILSEAFLYTHIACGIASLITFWIPVFTRKGNKAHRKIGLIYVYMMWVVVLTAAFLSMENYLQGDINSALFLGFLSVLSANPLWHGISILSNKRKHSVAYLRIRAVFAWALLIFGAYLMYYGIFIEQGGIRVLMLFFGFFGLTSFREVRQSFRGNYSSVNWYQEHYKGMITSGIAAYTAFLAFGGRQFLGELLPGMWQILPWIAPTIIGITAMRLMDRYYLKKGVIRSTRSASIEV